MAARAKAQRGPTLTAADADALGRLLEAGVREHTETVLRIAPLLAPFGSLVPQTRVRIRATGSVSYGRSIPAYPEEWGGGLTLPDNRDLRDAWPEGVTLPRAIVYNLAATTLGLPAVTSDIGVLDRRAAVLLDRHVPGYREIIASELPCFVKEAAGLVFGRKFAEATARRVLRAAAALWVDPRTREDLVAPTCLFAMEYLAVPRRGLRQLGRDQGAREPDDPRRGADSRDVERGVRQPLRRAPRASGGRCCRRSSTPRTRRACCWPGNSRSKRSGSSWTCASRGGCGR